MAIKTGDKCQPKTLFLSFFDPRSSIIDYVFDCRLPGVTTCIIILVCYSKNFPNAKMKYMWLIMVLLPTLDLLTYSKHVLDKSPCRSIQTGVHVPCKTVHIVKQGWKNPPIAHHGECLMLQ